jgi:hypothetical protein
MGDSNTSISAITLICAGCIATIAGFLIASRLYFRTAAKSESHSTPPIPEPNTSYTLVDAICAILILPTLPTLIDPQFSLLGSLHSTPPLLRISHIKMLEIGVTFAAALGLWRLKSWGWWLAVLVAIERISVTLWFFFNSAQILGGGTHSHNGSVLMFFPVFLFAGLMLISTWVLLGILLFRLLKTESGARLTPDRWLPQKILGTRR